MLFCVEAQVDYAFSLGQGVIDQDDKEGADEACRDAQALIDVEAPPSSRKLVPLEIGVELAKNNYQLSLWAEEVAITGQAPSMDSDFRPSTAQRTWRRNIDEMIRRLS